MGSFKYVVLSFFLFLLVGLQVAIAYWGDEGFLQRVMDTQNYIVELTTEYHDQGGDSKTSPLPENKYPDVYLNKWNDLQYRQGGRIGIGAYIENLSIYNFNAVDNYERKIGHKLNYLLYFRAWGDEDAIYPKDLVDAAHKIDAIPIITWEPWHRDFVTEKIVQPKYSLESISNGNHDPYIREWARSVRESNGTVIVRFAHEQSTIVNVQGSYPWQGNPTAYVKAFKHVVDIFRDEKVFNARFMWNPLAFWPEYTMSYYPGDDYVDYVGLTILNHGVNSGQSDDRWKQCDLLFDFQYDAIKTIDKPLFIAEFGSSESGGNKTDWLTQCISSIEKNPKVIGMISLEAASDSTFPTVSWSVFSSDASLEAFKKAVSSSRFK